MGELPTAPIVRIFRRNADDIRITEEAMTLLVNAIEKEGEKISRKAIELAEKEGRKTIQGKDIKRWTTVEETTEQDYIYISRGKVYLHLDTDYSAPSEGTKVLPIKFLENTLIFNEKLYKARNENEAREIMESFEKRILDSLMEPHWAYNIYEYRAWETPEKINDNVTRFSMWFDDYDGGDVMVEGYLINSH